MASYEIEYQRWLNSSSLNEKEKAELKSLSNDEKKLRFSTPLSFGTAGLRAKMHMGIGCMNRFTVARATRAIAELINTEGKADKGVAIAYDSRNNSDCFAKISASVLASAGIKVYIFDGIRPTPELSYAVIKLSLVAGINITASHNPKEYNGYKAYWSDGAQISPEYAKRIASAMDKFDVLDTTDSDRFEEFLGEGIITLLDSDFDEKYLADVMATSVSPENVLECADDLKVVYTPLHGAGYRLVPEIFRRAGLKHLFTVDEQMIPDGNFPTVEKPNPEYANVFALGIDIANKVGSDLVIATDPDADRIGVMTRGKDGKFKTISGNQMGALLLDYVITQKKKKGTLSDGAYCVKSIVSTDMAYKIAEYHSVCLHDVLTGFKYIGEVINSYTEKGNLGSFILGFEESYGYLLGEYARDKDAVGAALIILEMAAYYKKLGKTLSAALDDLYKVYGHYDERMIEIYMEGVDGIEKRRKVMSSLRENPPLEFGGIGVVRTGDYAIAKITSLVDGNVTSTGQPPADVLYYTLSTGDKIIIRPSGTEPKIKIYVLLNGESAEEIEKKAIIYSNDAKKLMQD